MRLGIEATNLRGGGAVTHLRGLLSEADPAQHRLEQVVVWAPENTIAALPRRPWLVCVPVATRGPFGMARWQRTLLPAELRRRATQVLFVPGGSYAGSFRPFVTMCQNMLPFERRESARYGVSAVRLRLEALRLVQTRTFRRAQGLVFLTDYARQVVTATVRTQARLATIPHGVDERFRQPPRTHVARADVRLLYVSIVDVYKHQDRVVRAVAALRAEGLRPTLDLVGPAYPPALEHLRHVLAIVDADGRFARYTGPVAFEHLHRLYHEADAFVFASSCENLPNILVEAMSAGLPIACSSRGPMPEVLGPKGLYFDPEDDGALTGALRRLVVEPDLRTRLARDASLRAAAYGWARCADETFAFLQSVLAERGPI